MTKKGMIQDCAGTASIMCCLVDEFCPDVENKTMTQMRSPIDGLWLPLAYINGGGLCVRWFRDEFSGKPAATYDELQAEAEQIEAGSEGILFIPHFAGRNLPLNPNVKDSFVGLDWKHTRAHAYRAIMEGIAYEYDFYYSIIRKLYSDVQFEKVYCIGGGSKSSLFNQIKADVLGLPLTTYEMGETGLVGSAVVAGVACGLFEGYDAPLSKIMAEGETYLPDMQKHEQYKPHAALYLKVIDSLEDVYASEVYKIG